MLWHEITVHTTEEAIEMISNFIHDLGAGGVSIEESGTLNKVRDTTHGQLYDHAFNDIPEGRAVIQGYFTHGTDMVEIMDKLKQSVAQLSEYEIDTGNPVFGLKEVDDEDWANAWKQYFKPIRISERLTIKPTWEDYEASPQELVIELDPGMAFGTGTHATTSLCLRALETVIQSGDDVIDVGTGSGILAIAASKLGARHVLALDLDPVAVESAQENTTLNGLDQLITIKQSDLLQVLQDNGTDASDRSAALQVRLPVQVVVANILAEIILMFVQEVYDVLQTGGAYVVSGVISSKGELVEQGLTAVGFTVVERYEDEAWVVIIARKL